ncbi:MAG: hypothetical protein AB7I30_12940, partial [Isosphaeraceae bacterium]
MQSIPRDLTRRDLLRGGAASVLAAGLPLWNGARSQEPGQRPNRPSGVEVLNPRGKVPVSFIIDDSTCLVNLAHFAIPQFAEVFPDNYKQDWKTLPREIPDAFVRKFGEWCHDRGIKGKYSVVPYPACVGWLDRELPGWSLPELKASLDLVRDVMVPDWDIHPEMVSHTRVVDTKTGRAYPEYSERYMENWRWTDGKSVDQLADYLAYALRILKNVGLPCEGVTTPGGFGNRVLPELSQATLESVRDVYGSEIPHYFRHLYTDDRSVAPRVEYASGLDGPDPRCVVSIIGCTGDWFGGWDGLTLGTVDQFITEDGKGGRLPEVIDRGEPAVLVCHWPGIYYNGEETGFAIFQEVVQRLHATYDDLIWMKLSEISRYWAARELTRIDLGPNGASFQAPFACPGFTLKVEGRPEGGLALESNGKSVPLAPVEGR